MQKMILTMALAVLLALSGCSEDKSDERTEADGPDARGPRGDDYLSTVLRSQNRAEQMSSMAALKGVGMGLELYRVERNNQYPDSLRALAEADAVSENVLVSPADRETAFVYLKPGPDSTPETVVVYDPALYPGDKINVLFADGAVRSISKAELDSKLKNQSEADGQ